MQVFILKANYLVNDIHYKHEKYNDNKLDLKLCYLYFILFK